ncbi:arabinose-5-phosphate isomerase [Enterovibrio norvegicus]|uniref:KpsF/GutQ family sugar-phosphate isomerase n=1 Tax=Enterovibrio norvegicus TaxID=188144 RepID=UPI0002E9BD81|nr:KpsF/GutQ family sugar-phosphate isomerase [Enterovibrio norvegicus]OEF51349.1 arabinose-5-phosphate isomerase [Enterovibrio norvegicus]
MLDLDINNYYQIEQSKNESDIEVLKRTLSKQADALHQLANNIDRTAYQKALDAMHKCQGHIIICGMGKSGHISKKISATLASTGTPSFFLHPSEAFHGDLGMITREDVVILISNSGETDEVLKLIPSLKSFGNYIVAITGNINSTLAKNSDTTLLLTNVSESCPNNLAPTTSTTMTLAIGDALAIALMTRNNFKPNDFARFHPGGSLGKRLLTNVADKMCTENLPLISIDSFLSDTIPIISKGELGIAVFTDKDKRIEGILTDGDLRRLLESKSFSLKMPVREVFNSKPITTSASTSLVHVEEMMTDNKIDTIPVVDDNGLVIGLISRKKLSF